MKHPNKAIEKLSNFKARCRLNSCFNFWLNKAVKEKIKIPLTNDGLVQALLKVGKDYINE